MTNFNVFRFIYPRRFKHVDYVLFTLPEKMPALPDPPRRWWIRRLLGDPPMNLRDLDEAFQRVAKDSRTKGVIIHLRGCASMGLADLQTLRTSITDLRKRGKHVVAYSSSGYELSTYYVATAADEILTQPTGGLDVSGLHWSFVFLKDALSSLGLRFEVISSSPYKTGLDFCSHDTPTPEFNEDMNRFMDSRFDIFVRGIAEGRNMMIKHVRDMIDGALYLSHEAYDAGYIDGIVHEVDLAQHLGIKHLLTWDQAKKILMPYSPRKKYGKYVALVPIRGLLVDGSSSKPLLPIPIPFVGMERSGSLTVVQQVRHATKDKRAAALILYVDSPGGFFTAAESIASAVRAFSIDRPVVVYMNNEAGSGGYFVSTAGRWIVAQPGTITGSIGAITLRLVDDGVYAKLGINRVEFARGKNAAISVQGTAPWTEAQKVRIRDMIAHGYNHFASSVAKSRGMTQEAIDAAGQGRLWTGTEAFGNGLVDELGGLDTAVNKACELAGIAADAPLKIIHASQSHAEEPPEVLEQTNPASTLNYVSEGVRELGSGRTQLLMPFLSQ